VAGGVRPHGRIWFGHWAILGHSDRDNRRGGDRERLSLCRAAAGELESYRRYLERGALAAALLSEITSILQIFEDHDFVGVYRQLQEVFQRAAQSGAPGTDPTFRDTVHEKCADRIGMLGRDEAVGVVRFYGFLNGFRNAVRQAFNGDLPMQVRIDSLKVLNTKLFPAELPRALHSRLETAANRRWRGWVLVGLIPVVAAIM
jgi:hypothetical protein